MKTTQLSSRDFAKTLRIAYSQMSRLYEPVIERTDDVLIAFYLAYRNLEKKEKNLTENLVGLLH